MHPGHRPQISEAAAEWRPAGAAALDGLLLFLLFGVALGVRLYLIDRPPLSFHMTRQYQAAIFARDFYFRDNPSIPDWRKDVSRANRERRPALEPQVLPWLAALGYRAMGKEALWFPRTLSVLFWLLGGVFLYLIAKRKASGGPALISTAFYLLLPFGVAASRSFQPDPLMLMLALASIHSILRHDESPSAYRLLAAAGLAASALFVKPHCAFVIFAAYAALSFNTRGLLRGLFHPRSFAFLVISLLPIAAYCVWTGLITKSMGSGELNLFFPTFSFTTLTFWKRSVYLLGSVIGYIPFVLGLSSILLAEQGRQKALLIGLWVGFAAFGLVFNYHIHTHDYYFNQLIPIVGLSLTPLAAAITAPLRRACTSPAARVLLAFIVLLAALLTLRQARLRLVEPDLDEELQIARQIGEATNHSSRIIFLSQSYGLFIRYHGEVAGLPWPKRADFYLRHLRGMDEESKLSPQERFARFASELSPEYFVVTDLYEFGLQRGLKEFLTTNFPLLVRSDDYLVFDLRVGPPGKPTQ